MDWERVWLYTSAFFSGISVPLYMILPAGTVANFGGGVATPAAVAFTRLTGPGDALCSILALFAARTQPGSEVRKIAARSVGLYMVLHFGAFLYAAHVGELGWWETAPSCIGGLAIGGVASLYWGWIAPSRRLTAAPAKQE